jgi:HK97 family phage prohead protease
MQRANLSDVIKPGQNYPRKTFFPFILLLFQFWEEFPLMENIYNYKTIALNCTFKDADTKRGIVTGYFASFGNKDSDNDIILKGAFQKTIEERGPGSRQPRIKHLLNHRSDQPIGKIMLLQEDDKGLYYESQVGTHFLGKEFIAMVQSELISEHSIGFRVVDKEPTKDGTLLKELQLWEGSSLTAWGANEFTPLTSMKGQDKETTLEALKTRHKQIEKFCRNSDLSDETLESILLYNKQLFQLVLDFTKETTEPGKTTLPDNKAEGQLITGLQSIFFKLKFPHNGTERSNELTTAHFTGH